MPAAQVFSRHLDAEIKKQGVDITNRNEPAYERKDLHIAMMDIGSSLVKDKIR